MPKTLLVLCALSLSACGILGKKEELKKIIEMKSAAGGCLNDFGPNMQKYADGTIADDKWAATWNCTIDALDMFATFVTGSVKGGYTQSDMSDFIGKFIVSNKGISQELVASSFALKAALIGGSREVVTTDEFKKFEELLKTARDASLSVLPHLRNRRDNPSGANLAALSNAIADAGSRIAGALRTDANQPLRLADAEVLISEVTKLHGWDNYKQWVPAAMAAKAILIGGSEGMIEAPVWPALIRAVVTFGGPVIAIARATDDDVRVRMTGPNEFGTLLASLARQARPVLDQAIENNDGVIRYSRFEALVDAIPQDPSNDEHYWRNWNRQLVRDYLLKLVINDFLWTKSAVGMDRNVLDVVYGKLETWRLAQTHLETIFKQFKFPREGVTRETFRVNAINYANALKASGDVAGYSAVVNTLIRLVDQYTPLFKGDAWQIEFDDNNQYSLGNLTKMIWINLAANHLLNSPDLVSTPGLATEADFTSLVSKFKPLSAMMRLFDGSVPKLGLKRFSDANMFMPSSNGDAYVDESEATYYIATIISSGTLQTRIHQHMTGEDPTGRDCRIKDKFGDYEIDALGWAKMSPMCFRNEYFANRGKFWDYLPKLKRYYDAASECDRYKLGRALEEATRRYGIMDNEPITAIDTSGFAALIHYIEFMFQRYDVNGDQKLNVAEALTAFPYFQRIMTQIPNTGLDPADTKSWEAVFTYVLKFGRKPETLGQKIEFIWWKSWRPFWVLNVQRVDVYSILPVLVTSPPPGDPNYDNPPEHDPIPGDIPLTAPAGCH